MASNKRHVRALLDQYKILYVAYQVDKLENSRKEYRENGRDIAATCKLDLSKTVRKIIYDAIKIANKHDTYQIIKKLCKCKLTLVDQIQNLPESSAKRHFDLLYKYQDLLRLSCLFDFQFHPHH